jgi:glycosyltransferase involved in cell wall biosynthesis
MKILNLIWGFTLGAGIDKCFLTYAKLGEVDKEMHVLSVCINLQNLHSHINPLHEIGAKFINIKSRKDFSWIKKLKEVVDEENPDVIFTHGFNGAIVVLIERLFKGIKVPLVFSYHGLYNPPTFSRKLVAPIFNSLPIWIYKHIAKKIVCVSEDSSRQLIGRGVPQSKVITVYNGIKSEYTQVKVVMDSNIVNIVSCSRIDAIKGLNVLLDALVKLRDKGIRFHYYMIGEGPDLESLKEQCKMLNLDQCVTFTGFQTNVEEWLNAADIFAIPSYQENHSIALLEAMRAGKAIVATNVGGNSESIRDGHEGYLVPVGDTSALADALEKMIGNEKLRLNFGNMARNRFVHLFTEEAMMKNLIQVLKT